MWSFTRPEARRVSWGMVALVVFAMLSIAFSAWGIRGFNQLRLPFVSQKGAEVITLTASDCAECASVASFINEVKNQGGEFAKEREVDTSSKKGKKLIEAYAIIKLPTVLVKNASPETQQFLSQFGDTARDGTFVLRDLVPPYKDVATNSIKGRFGAIYITDKSCKECYDVTLHKTPLSRLGMTPSDEKTFDIADTEGKQLVEKYSIETVPTLILQGELALYKSLAAVWQQVGTIESDGTHVFRAGQDSMGAYRILKTGVIKQPDVVQ